MTDTTGAEGVDTLKQFECLKFDDYTFDLTGPNAALILADDQTTDEDNATGFSIQAWDFDGGSPFISSISVTGGGTVSATSSGSLAQGMGTGTGFDISYDPNGAYETLAVGASTTETITVVIDDGQGNLSSKDIVVTITGVNDAPTLGAGAMGAIEDGAAEVLDLSALGDDIDSDDDGSTLTYTVTGAPSEGSASIAGTSLAFDPGSDFQNLAVGETRDVVIEVTATDAHGAQAVNNVTVTVTGTNDAPTLSAAVASATEDGASVNVDLAALGADVDSDDNGSTLTYSVSGAPAEGSASISGTTLTFDPGADFQDLAVGETRDVTVQVTATDQHGATAVNDVTVTVTGTNDAPVAQDDVAHATEYSGNGSAPVPSGFSLNTANGHSYSFVHGNLNFAQASAATAAMGGHLATVTSAQENAFVFGLTNGAWAWLGGKDDAAEGVWKWTEGPEAGEQFWQGGTGGYAPGGAYENWNPTWWGGNSEPNNAGNEDGIHMWGGGYWNDIPLGAGLGYVVEISSPNPNVTGSVAVNDSDIDNGAILSFALDEDVAGLTMNTDGSWEFDSSDPAYDYIAESEVVPIVASYTVTDEHGATDTATLTIHVTGTNDDPTASAIVAPATNEDAGTAAIDLLATAADVDLSDDLDVANVAVSSSDGRSITWSVDNETGAFSFDAGQFNDLAAGESATVTLAYDVVDGNGGSVANTAEITVDGVNDAPTATGGSGSVTEDGTLSAGGTIAVSDPDASDTHSFSVQGGGNGTYGSLSVDSSGNWTYTLNNGATNVQDLNTGDQVYDNFVVDVADGNGGTTTANVSIAVNGEDDNIAPVANNDQIGGSLSVLFVDDDRGLNGQGTWLNTLDNLGHNVTYEAISSNGNPSNIMSDYDLVLWSIGDQAYTNLTSQNVSTLQSYLDAGGNLLYAGGHNLYDEPNAGSFATNYLGVSNYHYNMPSVSGSSTANTAIGNVTLNSWGGGYYGGTMISAFRAAAATSLGELNGWNSYQNDIVAVNSNGTFTAATWGFDINQLGTSYRSDLLEATFDAMDIGGSATDEDTSLTIVAADILANDTDADGDALTISSVSATSALGASVALDINGNVVYDPTGSAALQALALDEVASDSFTYTVSDGNGGFDTATVTLDVSGLEDTLRIGVKGYDRFSTFINEATDHLSEAYNGNPDDYDVIILNRSNGDAAIQNWVAEGGLVITEWSASDWALDVANMLNADDVGGGFIETAHRLRFTAEGNASGLNDNFGAIEFSSSGATQYFRDFANIGPDVHILTIREDGSAATLGGSYGDGNVLVRGYDWQDRNYIYSDGVDGFEQILLNTLEYEYIG